MPLASVKIGTMSTSPATTKEKSASKFHGAYHQQVRQQAELRRIEAFRFYLKGKPEPKSRMQSASIIRPPGGTFAMSSRRVGWR